MIGKAVGNYRITQLLGEGGMGAVYLAEHPQIGRKAAVKVLHPELARSDEMVHRFFNEARAATSIHHPGIVEVLDYGSLPSGASYIVMEFLEGESLASRIRRHPPLSTAEAVEIAAQAASALGAAHARGIVHRDLKPDNLFLVPDDRAPGRDRVKVLDFGIAKLASAEPGAVSVRTRTGAVIGTPLYMSPEQCRGTREVDHRSDVYSLGVIFYEMACGQPPFLSQGHGELLHMHIAEAPPSPRSRNPSLPQELEDVILMTLEKDPAHRFQSMAALEQALRQVTAPVRQGAPRSPPAATRKLLAQAGRSNTTLGASTADLGPRRSRRAGTALVLAGAAAAGVAAWVWLARDGDRAGVVVPAGVPAPHRQGPAAEDKPASAGRAALPAPRMISVAVTSRPAGARVVRERDGVLLGETPFSDTWPAGAGVEALRLERDGHLPHALAVALDRGIDIDVELRPLPRAPAARRASPRPVVPAARPAAPRRVPGPAVPEPAPAPPPVPASPPPRNPVPI